MNLEENCWYETRDGSKVKISHKLEKWCPYQFKGIVYTDTKQIGGQSWTRRGRHLGTEAFRKLIKDPYDIVKKCDGLH
jgi:hypothetical protein